MKRMKKHFVITTICLSLAFSGCGTSPTAAQVPEPDAPGPVAAAVNEAAQAVQTEPSDAAPENAASVQTDPNAGENTVTLLVHGGWDEERDEKREDHEFTLEGEQAQTITSFFYDHEVQINDSPSASVETLAFQIGEDRLGTSMGGLRMLSGQINGQLVTVELSESEYAALYEIVSPHAQDVP